jgi:hypothetical protein
MGNMRTFTITNPVNLVGNNVTFATLGIEAAQELKSSEDGTGEEIQLVDRNGQEICYAEVLDMWGGPLGHVPAMLLEMNQDPLQRTFTGLHTALMLQSQNPVPPDTPISIVIIRPKVSTIIRPSVSDMAKVAKGGALRKGPRQ